MPIREVEIEWVARWTVTVEAEIADDLDEDALRQRLDEIVGEHGWEEPDESDADTESVIIIGKYDTKPPDLTMTEPAWADVGGWGSWATDGHCMVRKGSPLPSEKDPLHDWMTPSDDNGYRSIKPISIAGLLETSKDAHKSPPGVYRPRFAPLLGGGTARCAGGPLDPTFVWRDDVLVAVVMPCHREEDLAYVWADGSPVPEHLAALAKSEGR